MHDLTKKLRGLLAALDQETSLLHEGVSKGTITDKDAVSIGRILTDTVKKANAALEPLKQKLRSVTVDESKGKPGPYYFNGDDGAKCVVVIPKQSVVIRKGTDMDKLKAELGDRFPRYFTEKVSYGARKDFGKTAGAHPSEAKVVLSVVDFNEGTPRVSFKG